MDEFTMTAFPRYRGGSSGEVFATVSHPSLIACFGAMAFEVAGWLPEALDHGEEGPPQAIELLLEWMEAPAPAGFRPGIPDAPSDPTRPRRPGLSCARLPILPPRVATRSAALLDAGVLMESRVSRDAGRHGR